MLHRLIAGSILLGSIGFFSLTANAQDKDTGDKKFGYVGAERCGMCHKTEKQGKQLSIWKESKHSQAYKTLQSEEADKIAKDKGFTSKAADTKECLACHVSGYDVDASLKGAKFKMEDGVQCETCHGPGSEYQKVMKNRDEAMAKGLVVHKDKEKFCTGCHNSKSPTFKGFDYDKYWAKISHMIPKDTK
ncbi:MAG: cytochrome C554 [Ignavibacteria bacterium]|jgi:hypothetical protein|nr:cytochrome C554 [Ignavibacteria bacterium]MCU7502296.1 cytochrome C554 [Ignavibacteria bacterium]MCU7516660.1 cytochrome C554 [Ignavibacteria bacterium]